MIDPDTLKKQLSHRDLEITLAYAAEHTTKRPKVDCRYLITKEETCPICHGEKYLQNPIWTEFIESVTDENGKVDMAEYDRRYEEEFPDWNPPEEEPCYECEGEGIITQKTNLIEALLHFGLIKAIS